jgi:hypothetical protein
MKKVVEEEKKGEPVG